MTTKVEIPRWESMKTPFKDWRTELTEFFAASGDVELLDKSNMPDGEPNYLPVASNPAAFIAKCKGHEQAELLVSWTGLTKSATQIRNLEEKDVDEDDVEMYSNKVKRHNKKVDAAQDKLEEWPKRCAAAAAKIKIAIRNNKEARRAIEKIAVDDDELYNILEKLKTRFGDMQESAKAEVLLEHCFLMYEPGATAEEFTEIVDESHEQVVKQYGDTIRVEDLTSVMFEANLQLIGKFKTVCSQMAALSDEASFSDKKKLFISALKHDGKIDIDADAMKKAMGAMIKRAIKDEVIVAGKAPRVPFRRHGDRSKLGGAGRDEGLNAFFAQGDQGQDAQGDQKGKGKGKGGWRTSEQPWGSCHTCWQFGHIARECPSAPTGSPKGKGQLWAGRAQANLTQSQHGGESAKRWTPEQMEKFAMANSGHMDLYLKVPPDVQTVGRVVNGTVGSVSNGLVEHRAMVGAVDDSDNFVPTDAELQRRLNRPLHQKRTRDKSKPERLVELWMDSGASENLGPLDEVRANTKNQQDLDKEQVLTADANAAPLEVRMRGDLFGKLKVEKGHNKAIDVEFRGVQGLGKWLWSVADLYRKGALVQFAEPALGGSFIKLKHSEEKIPIECVNGKYFRVMVDIDDSPTLSYRQKQESNFYTTCVAAGVSGRILAQTQRLGLARNFKFFTDVNFGTDEASLLVNGQTPAAPKENQWRPQQVGALTYLMLRILEKSGRRTRTVSTC